VSHQRLRKKLHKCYAQCHGFIHLHSRIITFSVSLRIISLSQSQSQSYFKNGGLLPNSSSWRRASRDSRPEFFFIEHLRSYPLLNILSDERVGVSFTIAAGPRQRIRSRVRVPWDSPTYFTVSDLRLPWTPSLSVCYYHYSKYHSANRV
jgi:hypothetical protein